MHKTEKSEGFIEIRLSGAPAGLPISPRQPPNNLRDLSIESLSLWFRGCSESF